MHMKDNVSGVVYLIKFVEMSGVFGLLSSRSQVSAALRLMRLMPCLIGACEPEPVVFTS